VALSLLEQLGEDLEEVGIIVEQDGGQSRLVKAGAVTGGNKSSNGAPG